MSLGGDISLGEEGGLYPTLVEASFDGIFIQKGARIVFANQRLHEMLGYAPGELVGLEHWRIYHGDYQKLTRERARLRMSGEEVPSRYGVELERKDGTWFHGEIHARAVRVEGGPGIVVWIRDIHEEKLREEALRQSKERFRQLSENAPDIIYLLGKDGAFTYVNPAWERLLGHGKEEVLGRYFVDFVPPGEARTYVRIFKRVRDRKEIVRDADVTILDQEGKPHQFLCNAAPNTDERGEVTGLVGTFRDVTEQRRLEAQLRQAQKMEAVGTLAGGVAHDFNNLLMAILGNVSLMQLDLPEGHPHRERLAQIEHQVKRGSDLTSQLLGFARGGRYRVRPTDLNELVVRSAEMFGRTHKEIQIHSRLDGRLWSVQVDQGQMEQVFLNLFINAWQAMPQGGQLYLETRNVVLDENYRKPYKVRPGRYVKVSVTDTGVGMDAKTLDRIFEPFFTTREVGGGTGLGLAAVYGIIKGHDGIINAYSEPGSGTTFNLYLPVSQEGLVPEGEQESEQERVERGAVLILLVDDEEMVREVSREILQGLGYTVVTAAGGEEAEALLRASLEGEGPVPDLVILDMIMPGVSGKETLERLKALRPELKILLCSGYALNGTAQEILDLGCDGFVQKPFTLEEISNKLKALV